MLLYEALRIKLFLFDEVFNRQGIVQLLHEISTNLLLIIFQGEINRVFL